MTRPLTRWPAFRVNTTPTRCSPVLRPLSVLSAASQPPRLAVRETSPRRQSLQEKPASCVRDRAAFRCLRSGRTSTHASAGEGSAFRIEHVTAHAGSQVELNHQFSAFAGRQVQVVFPHRHELDRVEADGSRGARRNAAQLEAQRGVDRGARFESRACVGAPAAEEHLDSDQSRRVDVGRQIGGQLQSSREPAPHLGRQLERGWPIPPQPEHDGRIEVQVTPVEAQDRRTSALGQGHPKAPVRFDRAPRDGEAVAALRQRAQETRDVRCAQSTLAIDRRGHHVQRLLPGCFDGQGHVTFDPDHIVEGEILGGSESELADHRALFVGGRELQRICSQAARGQGHSVPGGGFAGAGAGGAAGEPHGGGQGREQQCQDR